MILAIAMIGIAALVVVDRRARRADEVRVVEVPFMTPGSDAFTTGRIIFIHTATADDSELLAHELVHVCQWEEQGIQFLWDYLAEYVENAVALRDPRAARLEISFEEDARLGEVDCEFERYLMPQPEPSPSP